MVPYVNIIIHTRILHYVFSYSVGCYVWLLYYSTLIHSFHLNISGHRSGNRKRRKIFTKDLHELYYIPIPYNPQLIKYFIQYLLYVYEHGCMYGKYKRIFPLYLILLNSLSSMSSSAACVCGFGVFCGRAQGPSYVVVQRSTTHYTKYKSNNLPQIQFTNIMLKWNNSIV